MNPLEDRRTEPKRSGHAQTGAALDEAVTVGGMLFGLWVGLAAENRYVRFTVAGPFWKRALRYVIGIAGLLAVYLGLRALLPEEPLWLGLTLQSGRYELAACESQW
jgi:hypothetical protein